MELLSHGGQGTAPHGSPAASPCGQLRPDTGRSPAESGLSNHNSGSVAMERSNTHVRPDAPPDVLRVPGLAGSATLSRPQCAVLLILEPEVLPMLYAANSACGGFTIV